jgi:RNase P/RNase MRP subunit p30
VKNLHNIKSLFKKYNGKNIGLEFLISDIRYRDDNDLGKWFFDIKWVYELCKRYNFQFILSSGASTYIDLISLKIFNTILKRIGIESIQYWNDLTVWLDNKKIMNSL